MSDLLDEKRPRGGTSPVPGAVREQIRSQLRTRFGSGCLAPVSLSRLFFLFLPAGGRRLIPAVK